MPLDWQPCYCASAEKLQKLEQWRLRQPQELHEGSESFGDLFGSLIRKDLELFASPWRCPCPYFQKRSVEVVLLPENLADTSERTLLVLVDSHYDTNFKPFILLGIVTAEVTEPTAATTGTVHSRRYAQGLSGIRVVSTNINCQLSTNGV